MDWSRRGSLLFVFALSAAFPGCKILSGDDCTNCLSPAEFLSANACQANAVAESQTTTTHRLEFTGSDAYAAQSFKVSSAKAVADITLKLSRKNTPDTLLKLELRADCSGVPCDAVLTTASTTKQASELTSDGTGELVRFTFPKDAPALEANTAYWMVVKIELGAQAANGVYIHASSADPYVDGTNKFAAINDTSNWYANFSTYDYYFEIALCE